MAVADAAATAIAARAVKAAAADATVIVDRAAKAVATVARAGREGGKDEGPAPEFAPAFLTGGDSED